MNEFNNILKIEDLNKLKITSIKAVIHFKYDNENYFLWQRWGLYNYNSFIQR